MVLPRKTLYVMNAILTTHVRVQCLKSVCEVTVSWSIGHQHVFESTMIMFRRISQRVEKFGWSTLRKIKHRPMQSRISTAIGIDDVPSRSFLHQGGATRLHTLPSLRILSMCIQSRNCSLFEDAARLVDAQNFGELSVHDQGNAFG